MERHDHGEAGNGSSVSLLPHAIDLFVLARSSAAHRRELREQYERLLRELKANAARLQHRYQAIIDAIDRWDGPPGSRRARVLESLTYSDVAAANENEEQERREQRSTLFGGDGSDAVLRAGDAKKSPFHVSPADVNTNAAVDYADKHLGSIEPAAVARARYELLGEGAAWLLEHNPDLFLVVEGICATFVRGSMWLLEPNTEPRRGRPRTHPDKHPDEIEARLALLRKDDDARRLARQAFTTFVEGKSARVRAARRRQGRKPSRKDQFDEHRARGAAWAILREELDMAATGIRFPRLANVLLTMLDERGCNRAVLAKAADAAGVLKSGVDKRKNLADLLGATRKELAALGPFRADFLRRSAWWGDFLDTDPSEWKEAIEGEGAEDF
jgi:hypothetical protein